jgi:hypothetical protein
MQRLPGNNVTWRFDVREDLAIRSADASTQSGERDARAKERDEIAAGETI